MLKFELILHVLLIHLLVGLSWQSCSQEYKDAFLKRHNELRAKHGSPPLTLVAEISASAQKWADHLAKAHEFEHSENPKYGENLYAMEGTDAANDAGENSVQAWYDEIKDYKYFGREPNMNKFGDVGHFTQLVWKTSLRVGVGCGVKGDYLVVVGQYDPPGNLVGDFKDNVPPAGSAAGKDTASNEDNSPDVTPKANDATPDQSNEDETAPKEEITESNEDNPDNEEMQTTTTKKPKKSKKHKKHKRPRKPKRPNKPRRKPVAEESEE